MAVIDVNIPTGYVVFQPDLESYCGSQPNHLLRYAEFYDQKVSFFLDYVSLTRDRFRCRNSDCNGT